MKAKLNIHGNERCRTIHVEKQIIPASSYLSEHSSMDATDQSIPEEAVNLRNNLMAIHGVTSVSVHDQFQIQIVIGEVFDWDIILPEINTFIEAWAAQKIEWLPTRNDPPARDYDY